MGRAADDKSLCSLDSHCFRLARTENLQRVASASRIPKKSLLPNAALDMGGEAGLTLSVWLSENGGRDWMATDCACNSANASYEEDRQVLQQVVLLQVLLTGQVVPCAALLRSLKSALPD